MDTFSQIVHELKQQGFIYHVVHRASGWFHEQELFHKEKTTGETQVAHTNGIRTIPKAFPPKVSEVQTGAFVEYQFSIKSQVLLNNRVYKKTTGETQVAHTNGIKTIPKAFPPKVLEVQTGAFELYTFTNVKQCILYGCVPNK